MDKLMLLADINACTDSGTLTIIFVIKTFINIAFMVLPMILIVMITIDLFKNVLASKDSDMIANRNRAIKRIIYCVIAFFVPTIINLVMNIAYSNIDDSSKASVSLCWENATMDNIKKYREIEEKGADQGLDEDAIQEWKDKADANKPPGGLGGLKDDEDDNGSNTGNVGGGFGGNSSGLSTRDNYTIYVGDSRTNGMCSSVDVGSNAKCIYENGKGISWLENTALSSIKSELNNHNNANIVINLGVNDLGSTNSNTITSLAVRYVTAFKNLAESYPNAKILVVSVGTVDESKTSNVKNSSINLFNNTLKSSISNSFAGSNTYFCDVNGNVTYNTTDGLHYDSSTYEKVYNSIKNCL